MSVILINAETGYIPLGDGVVHCSVSSPPYYSLRAYEGDQARDWSEVSYAPMPGLPPLTIPPMCCALGHEETPEAFIGHLVACYREVKRVLRDDGVCWVVIGDSYARSPAKGQKFKGGVYVGSDRNGARLGVNNTDIPQGLKEGDLMLMPHRLALALQGDGWTVRNDCVWQKTNPMPESLGGTRWQRCRVKIASGPTAGDNHPSHFAGGMNEWSPGVLSSGITRAQYTDCPGCPRCEAHGGYVLRRGSWRHTRAHEVVLHLTKSMGYWSDQEAVRESLMQSSINRISQDTFDTQAGGPKDPRNGGSGSRNRSARQGLENLKEAHEKGQGRNPRSVLTPKPSSYSGQHYATYPVDLIRPLIKSSCPTKCCPSCGSGWAAVIEKPDMSQRPTRSNDAKTMLTDDIHISNGWAGYPKSAGQQYQEWRNANPDVIIDYRPTCACHASNPDLPHVPGLCLDPFFGSGTTGLVARELGVDCIGLDLSYDYLKDQARARLGLDAWHAWHQGRDGTEAGSLEGLPLFEELTRC